MHKMVFINLPVADLPRAQTFYQALGFEVVPAYTNDQAACIKISDAIFAMLLVRPFFQTFTDKTIIDPATHIQVLSCLSCDSRAEVDGLVAKALAAGGAAPQAPREYPNMYGHGFTDPDGHTWELMAMPLEASAQGQAS
ncbi:glyoxalase/bleomycin resistance/extradiol dioxygenase family protein [Burkholderia sp. BCCIQ04A]|uniref:Glyoxalase/bleomycin resistance/extradiol dioxygenase family protein n=1 Tax=Burkholderia anthinoferrum TaxID=3090833 RepID=A0ABU5WM23_9BURK|nr:VOC family protein [Burkholderia anthinoferrum]MEB2506665.1 glyoxalase/bleomycin resistance/extradiol dioxygenase family protein [Burkholderia anthinoferrum]MEB2530089.1 glyoxalase/bleomycin resistance/extradiol dioxygenase family protein [Burkholderia anthinoferrum]MEB2563681.1 glyoxalase/bleomycin resistance/extradiol dioxygenase family protein [Burkholderia anthinoferrum]MEB2579765.1 glyoxalase/bleomycin resistance/extradiol dioxygenase family protein [Burkholderia anthinoferrum]MEB26342